MGRKIGKQVGSQVGGQVIDVTKLPNYQITTKFTRRLDSNSVGMGGPGRHNLRGFLEANSTQNYFLIARML